MTFLLFGIGFGIGIGLLLIGPWLASLIDDRPR